MAAKGKLTRIPETLNHRLVHQAREARLNIPENLWIKRWARSLMYYI